MNSFLIHLEHREITPCQTLNILLVTRVFFILKRAPRGATCHTKGLKTLIPWSHKDKHKDRDRVINGHQKIFRKK